MSLPFPQNVQINRKAFRKLSEPRNLLILTKNLFLSITFSLNSYISIVKYITLYIFIFLCNLLASQTSIGNGRIKGTWFIPNIDSTFFKSDTVTFIKMSNKLPLKTMHKFRRGFRESEFAIFEIKDFIILDLRRSHELIYLEIDTNDSTSEEKHFNNCEWISKQNWIKLSVPDWNDRVNIYEFRFVTKEKFIFEVNGISYVTEKFTFQKKKWKVK